VSKMLFEKAWEIAKLGPYERAVAEEFSDPSDFMTSDRMRQKLMGMPFDEVLSGVNDPMGDLDFRYLDDQSQLEGMADEDVKDIYEQVIRQRASQFPDETNRAADKGMPSGPPCPDCGEPVKIRYEGDRSPWASCPCHPDPEGSDK